MESSELESARRLLAAAPEVLVVTGAGVSADSGVPTFRGPRGLWKRHRPEELATPQAFARDPRLVWEWYGWRRARVAACHPNPAYYALARWARRRQGVRIVTQNVDGLHSLAAEELTAEEVTSDGASSAAVPSAGSPGPASPDHADPASPLELHGSLFRVRCTACPERYAHRNRIDAKDTDSLPVCRTCGTLVRPDVVWFGEALPSNVLGEAFRLAERADACLVIGTSAVVQPAASLPAVARSGGGSVIEVNPEPTPLSGLATVSLRAGAAEAIPSLLDPD
jgi:NAD-dependent deacetylase